jgi:hypothetical protein
MSFEVKIKGFKELDDELKKLPLKVQKTMMPKIVRAGANIVKKEASRLAPRRAKSWEWGTGTMNVQPPGTLKKGIIARRDKEAPKDKIQDIVTLKAGRYVPRTKDAFYGIFVEYGHAIRKKRGGSCRTETIFETCF